MYLQYKLNNQLKLEPYILYLYTHTYAYALYIPQDFVVVISEFYIIYFTVVMPINLYLPVYMNMIYGSYFIR